MPPTVAIEPTGVFIDSSGFIAVYVPSDFLHAAAILCRDKTLRFSRLYTSSAVIAETVAHIQRDHSLDEHPLRNLIDDFLSPERWGTALLAVEDEIVKKSLQMVRHRDDRNFSLVDAMNITLMEKHQIDLIFSYDGYYDGFPVMRGHNTRFIQRIGM